MITPSLDGKLEFDMTKYEVGGILEIDANKGCVGDDGDEVCEDMKDFGFDEDVYDISQKAKDKADFFKFMMSQVNAGRVFGGLDPAHAKPKKNKKVVIKKGIILHREILVRAVHDFLKGDSYGQIIYKFGLLPENSKSVKKVEVFEIPEEAILSYEPPCEMALLTHDLIEIRQAIIKKRHIDISTQIRTYIKEGKFSTFLGLVEMLAQHFGDNRFPKLVSAVEKLTGQDQSKFFETFIEMRSILLDR